MPPLIFILVWVFAFSSRGNNRAINSSQFSACINQIVIKMSLISVYVPYFKCRSNL